MLLYQTCAAWLRRLPTGARTLTCRLRPCRSLLKAHDQHCMGWHRFACLLLVGKSACNNEWRTA